VTGELPTSLILSPRAACPVKQNYESKSDRHRTFL
jgi:hypothetical protein